MKKTIHLVEFWPPAGTHLGYYCAAITRLGQRLILVDVRRSADGVTLREGDVEFSGLPYILRQVDPPAWWAKG